jgi:hypothetical protein
MTHNIIWYLNADPVLLESMYYYVVDPINDCPKYLCPHYWTKK